MRLILSLLLSAIFLLNPGCANGPKPHVGVSDPSIAAFDESYKGVTQAPIPYNKTEGWQVYPPLSEQAVFNYCAARNEPSTQAPSFDSCVSNTDYGTFDCQSYTCSIIPEGGGIKCTPNTKYSVVWAASANFVGFNQADNATLLDFCNITF